MQFKSTLRDLGGLIAIQAVLLALTFCLTDCDARDLRVQAGWAVFLIPGWVLGAFWSPRHANFARRHFAATVTAVGIHGWLAGACFLTGLGFSAYYIGFAIVLLLSLGFQLKRRNSGHTERGTLFRIKLLDAAVLLSLMVFSVVVYRYPRSNDISQFILQQQDMVETQSFQPSAIGMTGMGVDEPMPRWKSHLWHLLPCVIADATNVPVNDVLNRSLTIPLAFSVLVGLAFVLRSLSIGRPRYWILVASILVPVLLFYRSYHAFNYSFRLTNSFCLDKDFCLFFLIPTTAMLAIKWQRGGRHFGWPLLLLLPAIVKFHPITIVYLLGLAPLAVIGFATWNQAAMKRTVILATAAIGLFAAVIMIGDAQSHHDLITEVIQEDFISYQSGNPLHHWTGFYGAIANSGLVLDTTHWVNGRFQLRPSLIYNCGLLLLAHAGVIVWLICVLIFGGGANQKRRCLATSVSLAMCWLLWFGSRYVLTAMPHLSGGIERLHWFVYLPALLGVAGAMNAAIRAVSNLAPTLLAKFDWIGTGLVCGLILTSSLCYKQLTSTPLAAVRGVNSLLNFELNAQRERVRMFADQPMRGVQESRPEYLREHDRVLFLTLAGSDHYWLMKQGVFWSDPYAEAFALHHRGDAFREDSKFFYALWAHQMDVDGVAEWMDKREIDLVVDLRKVVRTDEYIKLLNEQQDLRLKKIQPGVWRRQ